MFDYKAKKDYEKFEKEIRHTNRFFIDPNFINSVKQAMKLNTSKLLKGRTFYRARNHKSEDDKNTPLPAKKMFNPLPEEAQRGRANPDGISYLYLSSHQDTCIKEVNPNVNDILTLGEFTLIKDIELIDLTHSFPISDNDYITSLNECIRLSFSNSQISSRPEIEYLPYQYICELIKNENYDGVLYKSSYENIILNKSFNIVLFDPSNASLVDSKRILLKVTSVNYDVEKLDTN